MIVGRDHAVSNWHLAQVRGFNPQWNKCVCLVNCWDFLDVRGNICRVKSDEWKWIVRKKSKVKGRLVLTYHRRPVILDWRWCWMKTGKVALKAHRGMSEINCRIKVENMKVEGLFLDWRIDEDKCKVALKSEGSLTWDFPYVRLPPSSRKYLLDTDYLDVVEKYPVRLDIWRRKK